MPGASDGKVPDHCSGKLSQLLNALALGTAARPSREHLNRSQVELTVPALAIEVRLS